MLLLPVHFVNNLQTKNNKNSNSKCFKQISGDPYYYKNKTRGKKQSTTSLERFVDLLKFRSCKISGVSNECGLCILDFHQRNGFIAGGLNPEIPP